jgi:hypothetical protein
VVTGAAVGDHELVSLEGHGKWDATAIRRDSPPEL